MLESRTMLSATASSSAQAQAINNLPALFVQNQGQWDNKQIRYMLRNSSGSILMTDYGPVFDLVDPSTGGKSGGESFWVNFNGANVVTPQGLDKSSTKVNYFVGDSHNFRTGVAAYEKIFYKGLYDGIDLYTWGKQNNLKYEFHVAPGADPNKVQVNYSGIEGLTIDGKGQLHVHTSFGEIIDDAPFVYQVINGKQVEIKSSFKLIDNHTYTFQLNGPYDASRELILDPQLDFSTYIGSTQTDIANAVTSDQSNDSLVIGNTAYSLNATTLATSNFFASPGPASGNPILVPTRLQTATNNDVDTFVLKFGPGGVPLWLTFYGGVGVDNGNDIATDSSGNVYIVGNTTSTALAMPTTPVPTFDTQYGTNGTNGATDAYLAKLNSNGVLVYSTYFGGTANDSATTVAVRHELVNNVFRDRVYFAGVTSSTANIASNRVEGGTFDTATEGFLAEFDLANLGAGQRIWARYVTGSGQDQINSIDIATDGTIYATGTTSSTDFHASLFSPLNPQPVTNPGANQTLNQTGGNNTDAFIAAFDTDGFAIESTYIGGSGNDVGNAISIDPVSGRIAIAGSTQSTFDSNNLVGSFPILHPVGLFGNVLQGTQDAYVVEVDAALTQTFGTYLGGTGTGTTDAANGLVYDIFGNLNVAGVTNSADFPFVDSTQVLIRIQSGPNANNEGFIVQLLPQNSVVSPKAIGYSGFLGGGGADAITDIATDQVGALLVVGSTQSSDFLTAHEANVGQTRLTADLFLPIRQTNLGATGNTDGFLSRIIFNHTQGVPFVASNVRGRAISYKQIFLSWDDNSDNETGFVIRRASVNAQGFLGAFSDIATVGAGVHSYTDNTPAPLVTYVYDVVPRNTTGFANFGADSANLTTPSASLAAPSQLNATAVSSTRVDLTWRDNSDNEINFIVSRALTFDGDFQELATLGANVTSYTDNSAVPNTAYTYRVQAVNEYRESAFAVDTVTTPDANAAGAPTNLRLAVLSESSYRLTWADNSDNEDGYSIERANFTDGIFAPIGTTGADETSFTDTTGVTGLVYLYRVRAVNGSTFSAYSNVVASNLGAALPAPTAFEALATSNSSITLTWRDNATIETHYLLERAVGAASDFSVIATLGVNAHSFVDTGLLQHTKYFYRVRATDGADFSAYSPVVSDTTFRAGEVPPTAPSVIRGAALSTSSIRITWRDNSSTETGFTIERATALDGPYAIINTVAANTQAYVDTKLAGGVVYYYRVRARDGVLRSAASAIIKVRTLFLPRLTIRAIDGTGSENSGDNLIFQIARKDNLVGDLLVRYAVSGTATNGTDYNKLNGTIVIANGHSTVQFAVIPKNDTKVESTETLKLTLVPSSTYRISPSLSSASGTIADNDLGPSSVKKKVTKNVFSTNLIAGLV
ncbi:MAG TPA: SBBP repeat-containing protein [Tepidisphaeraceae bacterium]|nr:SBBP repeat-containing protein [Tepidisphaeraceae bacterium]